MSAIPLEIDSPFVGAEIPAYRDFPFVASFKESLQVPERLWVSIYSNKVHEGALPIDSEIRHHEGPSEKRMIRLSLTLGTPGSHILTIFLKDCEGSEPKDLEKVQWAGYHHIPVTVISHHDEARP